MRTFGKLFLILIATFALVAEDAEARRMGGGGNFGRQRQSYSQPYQQQQAAPAQNNMGNNAAARPPLRSNSWMGPLAGLAIGGLLGSMFFGHPFQGMQIADILILGALAFGLYYLLRRARRTPAESTQSTAYEYAGSAARSGVNPTQFDVPAIGSGLENTGNPASATTGLTTPRASVPAWFDEASFTKAAKTHFIRLQAAWDRGDMKDIQEYTTPQLFAELSMERQTLSGPQHTDVVHLETEILDIATEGDEVLVSVRYSGEIREEEGGTAQPFAEVWHVQREVNNPKANWYIAGIQQV